MNVRQLLDVDAMTLTDLCRSRRDDDRTVISSREEFAYIDCRAVEIARCPGIVVVVIDYQPSRVSLKAEPGLDCRNHLIEISIQIHAGEHTSGRLALLVFEDMLGDISKTQLKSILTICVQPEYRRIFLLMPCDIFDGQLSLSNPSKPVENHSRSLRVAMKYLVHLGELWLSCHELCCFWNG